jgi:hypothetical protein
MFINFFRYLALVALLGGVDRWQVRWKGGSPTAFLPDGTSLKFRESRWLTEENEFNLKTEHRTLLAAIDCTWSRWDGIMRPIRYLRRKAQAMRGAVNARVLLYLLKDDGPWELYVWNGQTHIEKIYTNAAGWTVKHYSSGGIQAENKTTWAVLAFITAGWSGYWFIKSAFPEYGCADKRKYPLGENVPSLLLAFRGI